MTLVFSPMAEASIRTIATWVYEPPYALYNWEAEPTEEELRFFVDPANGYYSISDHDGALVGYCCFGADAQVPGGEYSVTALDIGLGVRPDLTGRGRGHLFSEGVVEFARRSVAALPLRVTVASFNQRAMRVWERTGFHQQATFRTTRQGREFTIFTREA